MAPRLLLLLVTGACGCAAFSPGLHFSEYDSGVDVVSVTPELLREQSRERSGHAAARVRDPNATAGPYEYHIAPLDVLSVTVWDHPELTIPAGEYRAAEMSGNPVLADGTVFYPHVGVLHVAGKTVAEVRSVLTERLRHWVENPQLDVRVADFRGKRVQVTGEVVQPAALPITDVPMRVQDAIAQARGLTPDAWLRTVTLTRDDGTYTLDIQALYDEGDLSQNWLLQDGDILHIPSRQQYKVFVLGEVVHPSSKVMPKGRMTLAEAIGDAAGFDPVTSDPSEIYVFRGSYEAPSVYHLDASSADALLLAVQFELQPHDVVYVTQYTLTDWNRVMTQLLPTIQGLWQTLDIGNRGVTAVEGLTR